MAWNVVLVDEVDDWFMDLAHNDPPPTAELVTAAIDQLEADGPALGRPLVDSIEDSKIHNMKELRPGSTGRTEVRILLVFDPQRQAVLLVAGDKAGRWRRWYEESIPLAERRYQRWLDDGYHTEGPGDHGTALEGGPGASPGDRQARRTAHRDAQGEAACRGPRAPAG